ncbi:MAG: PDZ domain-containing protein [Nitrospira sp. BO4]|nr:PDZ domain-containing protein [Nitrospira sp. BO4]
MMPVLIEKPSLRLAIIPLQPVNDSHGLPSDFYSEANTRVEGYIHSLRNSFPELHVIERSQIELALRELVFQARGHVREDNHVEIGRMLGADHLFVYQASGNWDGDLETMRRYGGLISGTASGKLIDVGTGVVVFQQTAKQNLFVRKPDSNNAWTPHPLIKNKEWAAHMALRAVIESMGVALLPSPIGISWENAQASTKVKVATVFVNGPGHQAGIRSGDWITMVDGVPVHSTADPALRDIEFTSRKLVSITVERDGRESTVVVRPAQRHVSSAPFRAPSEKYTKSPSP